MTRDEIGDMIAALPEVLEPDELIYRLVNWAVDREREACAEACEKVAADKTYQTGYLQEAADACVDAIRARGER